MLPEDSAAFEARIYIDGVLLAYVRIRFFMLNNLILCGTGAASLNPEATGRKSYVSCLLQWGFKAITDG